MKDFNFILHLLALVPFTFCLSFTLGELNICVSCFPCRQAVLQTSLRTMGGLAIM